MKYQGFEIVIFILSNFKYILINASHFNINSSYILIQYRPNLELRQSFDITKNREIKLVIFVCREYITYLLNSIWVDLFKTL